MYQARIIFVQHITSTFLEFQLPLSLATVSFARAFGSGSLNHNLYRPPW